MSFYWRTSLATITVLFNSIFFLCINGLINYDSYLFLNSWSIVILFTSVIYWPINSYLLAKYTKQLKINLPNRLFNIIFPVSLYRNKKVDSSPFFLTYCFLGRFSAFVYSLTIGIFINQILLVVLFTNGFEHINSPDAYKYFLGSLHSFNYLFVNTIFLFSCLITILILSCVSLGIYMKNANSPSKLGKKLLVFFFPYLFLSEAHVANPNISKSNIDKTPFIN